MKPLRIAQATFGERNRGHALLKASPSATVPSDLSGKMDLQGTAPPGLLWQPYFSGFAQNGLYVVSRTSLDPEAPRAGMVFSRAFLVPLGEFLAAGDIYSLFNLLDELGEDRGDLADIDWHPKRDRPSANPDLAEALLQAGNDPVVWPDETGLELAIAGLWPNLWPAARAKFSFRLAFTPQDVVSQPPTVVSVPASLASRWSGYRLVTASASHDEGVAFLTGAQSAAPLHALMADLEANPPEIRDLQLVVELHKAVDKESGADALVGALRTIGYLSPAAVSGRPFKEAMLKRAAESLSTATADEILMARNLDLNEFPKAALFWKAVTDWAGGPLWAMAHTAGAVRVLDESLRFEHALEAWRKAIAQGATAALNARNEKTVDGVWDIVGKSPPLLGLLFARTRQKDELERALADRAPRRMKEDEAKPLLAEAATEGFWYLHAAISSAAFDAAKAVELHIGQARYNRKSLTIALRRASKKEQLSIAVQSDEPLLHSIAGEVAGDEPALLSALDVTKSGWRAIWAEAIKNNPTCWSGPANARTAADLVLDTVVAGNDDAVPLLRCLATTPLADLSSHPGRAHIWQKLPADLQTAFLAATAHGWIERFLHEGVEERVEDELADVLLVPERLDTLLGKLVDKPQRGVMLFRDLPRLSEHVFRNWLERVLTVVPQLSHDDAETIGRLILARSWSAAASQLANASLGFWARTDLMPALRNCSDLIGTIQGYLLGLPTSTPATAKWRLLEEIGTELYPHGPEDQELWSRSGGKRGIFSKHATGAQLWRRVVRDAEKGKAQVDMAVLLKKMADDFPNNPVLKKMRNDAVFGAAR